MIRNTSQISAKWSMKESEAYLSENNGVSKNISSTKILYNMCKHVVTVDLIYTCMEMKLLNSHI